MLEVLDQVLHLNSFICVHKGLLQAGVFQIRDVFLDQFNRFMTYQEVNEITQNRAQIDFVTYNGLIRSIPQSWKRLLTNDSGPVVSINKNNVVRLIEANSPSSTFFKRNLNKQDLIDSVPTVWERDLGVGMEQYLCYSTENIFVS